MYKQRTRITWEENKCSFCGKKNHTSKTCWHNKPLEKIVHNSDGKIKKIYNGKTITELKTSKPRNKTENIRWIDGSFKRLTYVEQQSEDDYETRKEEPKQKKTTYYQQPQEEIVVIKEVRNNTKSSKQTTSTCMKCRVLEETLLNKNRALQCLASDLLREKSTIRELRKAVGHWEALHIIEQRRNVEKFNHTSNKSNKN